MSFEANLDRDPGMRDDPDVNPSSLRFEVGNLVLYKDKTGWFEGEVLKVCQRFECHNHSQFIPYIVWPHTGDADGTLWIDEDTEDYIRPRLEDLSPDPAKFKPSLAQPEDHFAYLYTGITNDPFDEDGKDMAKEIEKLDLVDQARIKPDGSIEIKAIGRRLSTATFEIPQEPIFGVPGHAVVMLGQSVHLRRQINSSSDMPDIIGAFKSTVPTETSLSELEEASKTSNEKMLQLGDALMSGVHGWPRDPVRSCGCFLAAAFGCTEEEEKERSGIAVGVPEAMVAAANVLLVYIKVQMMGFDLDHNAPYAMLLKHALRSQTGLSVISQLLYWISASLKSGWVSPIALELARSVKEVNLLNRTEIDNETRDRINVLLKTNEYRSLEIEFQKMQTEGHLPRGDPSSTTIELFRPKACEIFRDLNMNSDVIHIEYREIPRAPFPTIVFVILPSSRQILKVMRLPASLQVSPFSQESFQFTWLRVAFELHLGKVKTHERARPSAFTVLDSHGNREFAAFLDAAISGSGTQVRLVSHSQSISTGRRRRRSQSSLGEIVRELETQLLEVPGLLYDADSTGEDAVSAAQQEFVRHSARDLFASLGNEQARFLQEAEQLKAQGNQLFTSRDFNASVRCYSIAIHLLSLLADHNESSYKLIGTLLSNRAACFLELESLRTNIEFRKLLAQNAINDCTVALESRWAKTALPRDIRDKLKFRRDKASARYDALTTEYESVANVLFPEESTNEDIQEEAQGHDRVGGGRRRRRGRRNRHQINRRRQEVLDTEGTEDAPQHREEQEPVGGDAMLEYGQILYDNSLAKNANDGCPICLREFCGELARTHSAVLPCGEHALCVECICNLKKQSDKAGESPACPLCRTRMDSEFVEKLAFQIIEVDQALAMLLVKLPFDDPDESTSIAQRLLWKHDFRVEAVIEVLEGLLDDRAAGLFFREEVDLNHQQKQEIYRQARQPVENLQMKLNRLVDERRMTFETARVNILDHDMRQVRSDLAVARRGAREEIYNRLNSVGNMGGQRNIDGNELIQIDFHGLHVGEMKAKFKEHVKPILPVVGKIMIITGRGLHSSGGTSKLKNALIQHIDRNEKDVRWEVIAGNPGALNVVWKPTQASENDT